MLQWNHYALCDPRYEGTEAVRYIGRTTESFNMRVGRHKREARNENRAQYHQHRSRWLRRLWAEGLDLVVVNLGPGGENHEANLIAYYRGLGCFLTNQTDGGDGTQGRQWTPEQRERGGELMRNRPRAVYDRIAEKLKGKRHSEGTKRAMSRTAREVWNRPEVRAARIANRQGELNGSARLNEGRVEYIRTRFAIGGVTKSRLSRILGVSVCAVFNVLAFRTWSTKRD